MEMSIPDKGDWLLPDRYAGRQEMAGNSRSQAARYVSNRLQKY